MTKGHRNSLLMEKHQDIIPKKKTNAKVVHNEGVLNKREQFILTLMRMRKGLDVKFLADTFGFSPGQVFVQHQDSILYCPKNCYF